MAEQITVYKLDANGREVWQYPARLLARTAHSVCLEAFFNRADVDLGYTVFRRGDRFVEYFYSDRWYNLFVVFDGQNGLHKGWYANICRPAELGETAVRCEDLALDFWIDPDRAIKILDEDEFEALPLTAVERAHCQAAVQQLIALAQGNWLPLE
jgi:uncharacterized protein